MARPILLSNGAMHVGINLYGLVHDFYYPYIGHENHATANNMRHKVGVWVEDNFSWLDDGTWQFKIDYEPQALIGITQARNETLGVTLELQDAVDANYNAFLRNIHIINEFDRPREVRLFLHQVFRISNSLTGDTAQYLPAEPALLHYKGRRAFVASAVDAQGKPFDQFSVGLYGIEGKEGTFRDAEDGQLDSTAVAFGSVDSVMGFTVSLETHGSSRVHYWLAAGKSQREALDVHHKIRVAGLNKRFEVTQSYWQQWLQPAEKFIEHLEKDVQDPFRKSLLIIKSHIDKRGAVIAATDTTMRNYSRDTYAYCWPRDAAYALWPLLRLGYTDELKSYFHFCRTVLDPGGYLVQKYRPDGAPGSSWHPYIFAGRQTPPIQEDETAILLFLFGQYYRLTNDEATLREFYSSLIRPAANFLATTCLDPATKLPHATYDLWEEKFLTTTYTTGVTYAALLTVAHLAEELGNTQEAVRWQTVADDMRAAAPAKLFNKDKQFFYKGFISRPLPNGEVDYTFDDTIDTSSFYGAFMFGLFDVDGPEMRAAYQTLKTSFKVSMGAAVTPLPRYMHDQYDLTEHDTLGNPWFITTLWHAQYLMEVGKLEQAKAIIEWVRSMMLPSGVLAEQINPRTHAFVSVAPLIWSQAEFINTILDAVSDPSKGGADDSETA